MAYRKGYEVGRLRTASKTAFVFSKRLRVASGWYSSKVERTTLMALDSTHKISSMGPDCDKDTVYNPTNICDECKTSVEDFKKAFPNTKDSRIKEIVDAINKHAKEFGLDSKEKLQHFLAQAGHESKNVVTGKEFEGLEENMGFRWSELGTTNSRYFNPIDDPTKNPRKANPNDFKRINNPTSEWVDAEKFANFIYDDNNSLRKKNREY